MPRTGRPALPRLPVPAPAVPDPKSQRFWAMALSNFETAAADCQTGASNLDASMISQANAHILIATNDLRQVVARIKAIAGQG